MYATMAVRRTKWRSKSNTPRRAAMTSHGQSVTESPSGRTAPAGETPMRAIVQEAYGSADVLHLASIGRPAIGEKEVLVRVHAAGLDRGTWHVTTGLPYARSEERREGKERGRGVL